MTVQTSQLAVSLEISATLQLRNVEKAGLQIIVATMRERLRHRFDLVNDWPHPFVMLSIR